MSYQLSRVKLKCDGYEVSAVVEQLRMKLVVGIYINGYMRGKWLNDINCEESVKFFRRVKGYLVKGKKRTDLLHEINKRGVCHLTKKYYQELLDDHYFYVKPYWPNAKSFFRHIQKTCTNIELMEE